MTVITETNQFIKPTPKPELNGELGLYASEIAQSLGVPAKRVREKLRHRDLLETLEENNLAAVAFATLNESNGLEFTEYALEVDASKFLVARWNNKLGDSYLAFLIKLESKVNDIQAAANKDPLMANILALADVRMKQIEMEDRLDVVENKLEKIGTSAPDNKPIGIPEDYTTIKRISPMFKGVSYTNLRKWLRHEKHPTKEYYVATEDGLVPQQAYQTEGLGELLRKLANEISGITEKTKIWECFHPAIGKMHINKKTYPISILDLR